MILARPINGVPSRRARGGAQRDTRALCHGDGTAACSIHVFVDDAPAPRG